MDEVDKLHDHVAERQLLSIALAGTPEALTALSADAFDHWQHAEIARAITTTAAAGHPVHAATVAREVVRRAGADARANRLGTLVAELATTTVPASAADYYADRLAGLHAARSVNTAAEQFQRLIAYAAVNDDDAVLTKATTEMRDAITAAETAFRPVAPAPPLSLAELLDEPDEPYDWLVPGLLERADRLILTGFEGTGKSYLLAQLALTVAAGLHPFTGDALPGWPEHRTLIFDVENSRRQLRRRYRRIADQVDKLRVHAGMGPTDWSRCVRIVSRPEGVSLTEPRELARIEQNIELTGPDLVVAGPLYKLSKLDVRDEQAAKELCDTLDGLRVRHDFTLIMEGHAGHAGDGTGARKVRPIGSSLFLRWPEFGIGLIPAEDAGGRGNPDRVDVRHWRGQRDERHFPRQLAYGQRLPWQPANPDYYDVHGNEFVA